MNLHRDVRFGRKNRLVHAAVASAVRVRGVRAIPATYLIDPEGTIIRIDLRGKPFDETLARLIGRPATRTGAR